MDGKTSIAEPAKVVANLDSQQPGNGILFQGTVSQFRQFGWLPLENQAYKTLFPAG